MQKTHHIRLDEVRVFVGPDHVEIKGFAKDDFIAFVPATGYVNTGPEHMPAGLADRMAHDRRLAKRGEKDES